MRSRKVQRLIWGHIIAYVAVIMVFCIPPVYAEGLTHQAVKTNAPETIQLGVGTSIIIDSPKPFARASVANPEVADPLILSPKQVYLTGKKLGVTTLTLWGKNKQVSNVFNILVSPDLTKLKAQLHQLFPNEKNIKVTGGHDGVALSGQVSSANNLTRIVAMAEPYAPEKVSNLLHVAGVQQVMLEVKVAEMSRGLTRNLGIGWHQTDGDHFSFGLLNDTLTFTEDQSGNLTLFPSAIASTFFGLPLGNTFFNIVLDFLKQNNLTKILAEPTLVAVSGQEASFLAGGEFPIPVPGTFGRTTIEFKEFGVRLGFNPTVLNDEKISLKISPEVSELDFSTGVNFGGFTIPSLVVRRTSTVLELGDGQSFAIAGLIQDNVRETVAKYPILGDIPIIGALFRSSQFQKNETELVIIVTPRLVKPLDLVKQPLPTDFYLEPNDFEQMLLGYVEGAPQKLGQPFSMSLQRRRRSDSLAWDQRGLDGAFGHIAP